MFTPSVTLPAAGSSALRSTRMAAPARPSTFKTVSLEQLVDSPVLAGRYFRESRTGSRDHAEALSGHGSRRAGGDRAVEGAHRRVRPAGARDRRSLQEPALWRRITSSSRSATRWRTSASSIISPATTAWPANTFTDDREFVLDGLLLPHEFTHSWNGKYRRPAGLRPATTRSRWWATCSGCTKV